MSLGFDSCIEQKAHHPGKVLFNMQKGRFEARERQTLRSIAKVFYCLLVKYTSNILVSGFNGRPQKAVSLWVPCI